MKSTQISFSVNEILAKKLQKRSKEKAKSLSEYVREMVELGVKIDERNDENSLNSHTEILTEELLLELWRELLSWSGETRVLVRALINHTTEIQPEERSKLLSEMKQKSLEKVNSLLNAH